MWIEQAKTGYHYYERYKDPMTGKWRRVCVTRAGRSRADQRAAQRALESKIETALSRGSSTEITLKRLTAAYIAAQKVELKEQTVINNRRHLNTIERLLGDVKVSTLTAPYVRERLEDKPVTYNERIKRFKALMRWAYRNDYVQDIAWLDKLQKMKEPSIREKNAGKFLDHDEIAALLDGLKEERWKLLTELLLMTGMRVGEAISLDNDDVSDAIYVSKTFSPVTQKISSTKTEKSNRTIFIQPELEALIHRIRKFRAEDMMREGYRTDIFLPSRLGGHISYTAYSKYIRENSERILGEPVKVHAFRHTHVAMLAEQGFSLEEIARRVGHDSKVTKEVYYHVTKKMTEKDKARILSVRIV